MISLFAIFQKYKGFTTIFVNPEKHAQNGGSADFQLYTYFIILHISLIFTEMRGNGIETFCTL